MKIIDRFSYFCNNLFAFCLFLIFIPFRWVLQVIGAIITLTITDGSARIAYPWEWDWLNNKGDD